MPAVGNETNHMIDGLTVRGGLALEGSAGVTTYLNRDVAGVLARSAVRQRAAGYFTETFPYGAAAASAGTALTSGVVYGGLVGLLAGDTVSGVTVAVGTAGATFSGIGLKVGLYSKTGTLLASSSDASASYSSTGKKTTLFTTPFTVTSDDGYYVVILAIASSMPAVRRGTGAANDFGATTSGVAEFVVQTGQTDLPASATLTATNAYNAIWFGVV